LERGRSKPEHRGEKLKMPKLAMTTKTQAWSEFVTEYRLKVPVAVRHKTISISLYLKRLVKIPGLFQRS